MALNFLVKFCMGFLILWDPGILYNTKLNFFHKKAVMKFNIFFIISVWKQMFCVDSKRNWWLTSRLVSWVNWLILTRVKKKLKNVIIKKMCIAVSSNILAWKFCVNTVSTKFRTNQPKLWVNFPFPQNFHTRKLTQISVFSAVCIWWSQRGKSLSAVSRNNAQVAICSERAWRIKSSIKFDYLQHFRRFPNDCKIILTFQFFLF